MIKKLLIVLLRIILQYTAILSKYVLVTTSISYQKIRDIICERNGMAVDIAGLTLIFIKDTAQRIISKFITATYKKQNNMYLSQQCANTQLTTATLKDLHCTCSLTKFNDKGLKIPLQQQYYKNITMIMHYTCHIQIG